jgi:hypothetical protein
MTVVVIVRTSVAGFVAASRKKSLFVQLVTSRTGFVDPTLLPGTIASALPLSVPHCAAVGIEMGETVRTAPGAASAALAIVPRSKAMRTPTTVRFILLTSILHFDTWRAALSDRIHAP